jgi:hypothetical protein
MKTFTDNAGRTWTLVINVDAIRRVRSLAGVNLMDAVDGNLIERLVADPVLLCDVIYAVAKPEADANKVTDEEFGRSMAGDAIDHATTALLEELVDFFPRDRRRLLTKAMEKLRKLNQMAVAAVETKLDSGSLERQMEAALAELEERSRPQGSPSRRTVPGGSSGTSPESSAWTPEI